MKPNRALSAAFLLFLLFAGRAFLFSSEPVREWTSNGVPVIGAWEPLRDTTADRITLESSDGSQRTYSLADLSEEDRAYVEAKRRETGWEPMANPGVRNIYALLVGVTDYANYDPLKYAVNDMRELQQRLLAMNVPAGNITLLVSGEGKRKEPSKSNIERELDALLGSAAGDGRPPRVKKGDVVFIALSGHGTQTSHGAYFMPDDVSDQKSELESTSISIEDLQVRMNGSPATFKWLLVDACRSRPPRLLGHEGERSSSDYTLSKLQMISSPPLGMVTMQSCSEGQSSWESDTLQHGIFTSTFISGLGGEADLNGDGSVTMSELTNYLSKETPLRVRSEKQESQMPYMSAQFSDFIIVDGLLKNGLSREVWSEADAYFGRARQYRRASRYDEAKREIDRALDLTSKADPPTCSERQKYLDESDVIEGFQAKSEAERRAALAEEARQRAEASAEEARREAEEARRAHDSSLLRSLPADSAIPAETPAERVSRLGVGSRAGEQKTLTANGVSFTFCWCPAGEFDMGSPESEEGRYEDEDRHHVRLTQGFWLLESELTQGQWEAVMGTTVADQRDKANKDWELVGVGPHYPMYYVNWEESAEFCRKLSALTGERVQLPTESQWEYACRAGSDGPYAGTGELDEMGWYDGNSGDKAHEVKRKKPNAWGLYDMHGNVWEWCSDWLDDYPSGAVTDPTGSSSGSFRVLRGGSWFSDARVCRSADRGGYDPSDRDDSLGLRPAVVPAD